MLLEVISPFYDLKAEKDREVGETFEATATRFKEINNAGCGELVIDVTPKPKCNAKAKAKED